MQVVKIYSAFCSWFESSSCLQKCCSCPKFNCKSLEFTAESWLVPEHPGGISMSPGLDLPADHLRFQGEELRQLSHGRRIRDVNVAIPHAQNKRVAKPCLTGHPFSMDDIHQLAGQ